MAMRKGVLALVLGGFVVAAGPIVAQDRAALVEAFSGEWFQFDPAEGTGAGPCRLTLQGAAAGTDGPMPAESSNCRAPVADLAAWTVENGQMILFDAAGTRLAELGGNQRRLTGVRAADELGIVIERASGDGSNAQLASAVQRHRCYYLGTTSDCAPRSELQMPDFPDEEPRLAEIETLGNLLARSQPRRDASSVGTIPQGTCIRVNQCLTASDGIWCRARFGDVTAWLAKNAVRQEEWPIVTFRNGCSDTANGS
jgi:hypothetical protein